MRLGSLDLNLLLILDALVAERNVTRAAKKVGLSQPAMSSAPARAWLVFGDQFFKRVAHAYEQSTDWHKANPQI